VIRVLVVDDSAFARKVVRDLLGRAGDIDVVGVARDGLEALEKIDQLHPDVVTLDLAMPLLDGAGVLHAIPRPGGPRVVVVSTATSDSERAVEALQAGAVALVHKPTTQASSQLYELNEDLVHAVRSAYTAITRPPPLAAPVPPGPLVIRGSPRVDLVAIGTSTGGPQALTTLLSALPGDFPAAIAIVLHIPTGYTEALAKRLDDACELEVLEASPRLELKAGRVVLARSGLHLRVTRDSGALRCALDLSPATAPHRPSVDVLLDSVAHVAGSRGLGVILTGMGDDGLAGSRALVAAGGRVLTEASETCVVYGMPRVVKEAGLSAAEAPLTSMARALAEAL
jgi:two-component system chemotaxis response regulator CheB